MQTPSARIRQTKEVLERLEKRLERYYQPGGSCETAVKHTDLVKDFQTKLHQRKLQELDRPVQQTFSSTELKYSRASDGKHKLGELERPPSLQAIRSQPRFMPIKPLEIKPDRKTNDDISKELRQLKHRLEKVEKSHIKKEVKLEKQVDKLKRKLSKSNKLNLLLMKQLSPTKAPTSCSTTVLPKQYARALPQQPLQVLKARQQAPKFSTAKRF